MADRHLHCRLSVSLSGTGFVGLPIPLLDSRLGNFEASVNGRQPCKCGTPEVWAVVVVSHLKHGIPLYKSVKGQIDRGKRRYHDRLKCRKCKKQFKIIKQAQGQREMVIQIQNLPRKKDDKAAFGRTGRN